MDKELKKQVGAIRVSNPVGLLPRKAWNVLLINAYETLLTEDVFIISKKTLAEAIGFNSNDTDALVVAMDKLQSTFVEWDVGGYSKAKGVSFDSLSKSKVQMLGGVTIKGGNIIYDYSPQLKKILYNPVIYQRISISQQKVFNTAYGLYLWENCLKFVGVGSTGFSSVEEWRKLLGATTKAYDAFKTFKISVLVPAIKEINKLSNIHITLKTEKTGRKITHIGFDVVENKQEKFFVSDGVDDIKSSKEYQNLKEYKIEELKAITLIQEYGYKYISEKIKITKEQVNIKNPAGFLIKSIEKDWKDSTQEFKKIEQQKQKEKRQRELEKRNRDAKKSKEVSLQKEEKRREIKEFIKSLDKDILMSLNQEFIKLNKETPFIKEHLQGGKIDLRKPIVKINYYEFIYKKIKR